MNFCFPPKRTSVGNFPVETNEPNTATGVKSIGKLIPLKLLQSEQASVHGWQEAASVLADLPLRSPDSRQTGNAAPDPPACSQVHAPPHPILLIPIAQFTETAKR